MSRNGYRARRPKTLARAPRKFSDGLLATLVSMAMPACGGSGYTVPPAHEPARPPAVASSGDAPPPSDPGVAAERLVEGNGEVIEVPMPGSGAVAFRVLFYTGSIDDPPGKEGLTAITAKLMAEGGTRRMTYAGLLRALYPLAAKIEVQVDKEETVFSGVVHRDHASRFIPILSEVIREPRLGEPDLNRIRDDMVNDIEKRLKATDDENLGKEMLNLMLYEGHPYGHFVGGTTEGLRRVTLEDVKTHASRVFGRRRMLIGIGGAIEPKVRDELVSSLAALPEGDGRVASLPPTRKLDATKVWIAEKPGKAVAISIGYPHGVRRGHPDFAELALVQSYFGEHRQFHGVLMSEMREKRGLNYGDYAYVENFIQEGWSRNVLPNIARRQQHFEIWIRPVDPKDSIFSIRLAMFLLNRIVTEGVPDKGVADTKQFLEGYTRLWDLTASRRIGHALDEHFYGTVNYLAAYRKDLAGMTSQDVNQAVRKHLVAWPVHIAIVAPDAQALKRKLVSGERSEKTYQAKVDDAVLRMDESVSVLPLNVAEENVRVLDLEDLFVR